MADREKLFATAERLLRQGKVQAAMGEFRRLTDESPRDVLMLNRVGDALAKAGRTEEAVGYYGRVAEHFTQSGFLPKAIAILKKIVKLDPSRVDALVQLGETYLRQKLPGEARTYLLLAADRHARAQSWTAARKVYERLVQADPEDARHRVRLAEARAAEGNPEQAGEDLLELADRLRARGAADDAERAYRRAGELLPGRAEPVLGIVAALVARERLGEAIGILEDALRRGEPSGPLVGELVVLQRRAGRHADATALLASATAELIPDEAFERLVMERPGTASAEGWTLLEPVLERWGREGRGARRVALLERLATLDEHGTLEALRRLVDLRRAEGDPAALTRTLHRLTVALRSRGEESEAQALDEQLAVVELEEPAPVEEAGLALPEEPPGAEERSAEQLAAEAPAVPLTPLEEEFVAGQLTESEVLQNYGLAREALERLRAVTERFPGHVAAQEKLAELLRHEGDRPRLQETLVALAFARRAAGALERARAAAEEALRLGQLEHGKRRLLERLEIVAPLQAGAGTAREAEAPPAPVTSPLARRAAAPPRPASPASDDEVEIVFEDEGPPPAAPAPPRPTPTERRAPADAIEEIGFYLDQGMVPEALARLRDLRRAGLGGPDLDALEERASREAARVDKQVDAVALDDDLIAFTAELGNELGDLTPAPAEEQSLAEVFDAFKRQVEQQVSSDDARTHYDLGIAYKEMGLLDDALDEFRTAARSPDLRRQACAMAAVVHLERGEPSEAVPWYRSALEALPERAGTDLSALRYELGSALAQAGQTEEAIAVFREVMALDPEYRDVRVLISQLERSLGR